MRREIICDDITGEDGALPVTFSLDGQQYSIDLVETTRAKLAAALAPFVEHAQRVRSNMHSPHHVRAQATKMNGAASTDLAGLKAWARQHDVQLPRRGRIPSHIRAQYDAWSSNVAKRGKAS